MYENLIQDLKREQQTNYTIPEVEHLADSILVTNNPSELVAPTPIIKIASDFGFKIFKLTNLGEEVSGNMYVGGTTKKVFQHDKVIVVQDKEDYYHQRFIIAHELGHYLLDYIGNPIFENPKKFFSKTYIKADHQDSSEEVLADRFAAELLMPARLFMQKYLNIMDYSQNNIEYTIAYLSTYFEVKKGSIRKRIKEVIEAR